VAACLLATAGFASAAECIGNCGTSAPVAGEVVTAPPNGAATYDWVSTSQGQVLGAAQLDPRGTNGSTLTSSSFFAAAGAKIEFWFNYVTSDGAEFADYAWARLKSAAESVVLFTARTLPDGSIVPGFDLPGVNATLEPGSVPIIPGAPGSPPIEPPTPNANFAAANDAVGEPVSDIVVDAPPSDELGTDSGPTGPVWAPLGGSSGSCFDAGCGHTGWVKSTYVVQNAGTYQLEFGVANWLDNAFDSGMAFNGLLLDGAVIGDGSAADDPLLPTEIGPNGEFRFTFTPTPNEFVFIDPTFAVGYDYEITGGDNSILSALFPLLSGDADGYQIYELGTNNLLGSVLGGQEFVFNTAVDGFSLRGIDEAALLDPTNPTAFVTGLKFLNNSVVSMSQTPVTITTGDGNNVPEPATWLLTAAGLAAITARRRKAAKA
jgi:PEP-CTERM motif